MFPVFDLRRPIASGEYSAEQQRETHVRTICGVNCLKGGRTFGMDTSTKSEITPVENKGHASRSSKGRHERNSRFANFRRGSSFNACAMLCTVPCVFVDLHNRYF